MIPRTAAEAADLQRCRERQAATAWQQVEHHDAMRKIWVEKARGFQAEARDLAAGRTALVSEKEQPRG